MLSLVQMLREGSCLELLKMLCTLESKTTSFSRPVGWLVSTYTILPKVLGRPLLMNRFDYFSHFYEYQS